MKEGKLQIYCGNGKGKTTAAIGQAIREASKGRSVFIVQFLKGKQEEEISFIKRLEPEIKLFRFQKREEAFENLTEQEKEEENLNIKNGLNFARKVIQTEECDVLILDEILGLTDRGIVTIDELKKLINQLGSGMELYLTGTSRCEELWPYVDEVTEMTTPYRRTSDSHFCEED